MSDSDSILQTEAANDETDCIIVSRPITRSLFLQLERYIRNRETQGKKGKFCKLFLTTYGGDPDAAFLIGKLLQNRYETLKIIVSSSCKSAGTLLAIAANSIAISDTGELGPLDTQVPKQDEIGANASSRNVIESVNSISQHLGDVITSLLFKIKNETRLSSKIAGDMAVQVTGSVANALYSQIDPQRLAEMNRTVSIALSYGKSLSKKTESVSEESLIKLIMNYPSHGFVIDFEEAKTLFNKVDKPTELESKICQLMWSDLQEQKENSSITIDNEATFLKVINDANL